MSHDPYRGAARNPTRKRKAKAAPKVVETEPETVEVEASEIVEPDEVEVVETEPETVEVE